MSSSSSESDSSLSQSSLATARTVVFQNSASDGESAHNDCFNGGPSAALSDSLSDRSSDDDVLYSVSERSAYSEASLSSDLSEWDSYDESSNGESSDDEDDDVCSAIKERRLKARASILWK